jgi:glycosyltransferase involved in cell wall biosynthesis
MQIVVSDDASTDGTAEIVERELARYRGPHRVEMHRRQTNSGSKSAHLNDAFARASGDLLVSFDGDDVSEPDRVRKITDAFARDETVRAVYSSYSIIDEAGRPRGPARIPRPGPGVSASEWFARVDAYAAGTTLAIHREVVEAFGVLDPDIHEDLVLPFRASLLGDVVYIPEELVRARRRGGSLTADLERFESIERYRARIALGIRRARERRESRLRDLRTAEQRRPERAAGFRALQQVVADSIALAESTADLVDPSAWTRLSALARLWRSGAYPEERVPHSFLALWPGLYLRYKRRSLGAAARNAKSEDAEEHPG